VSRFRFCPEALAEFEEAVDYYLELSPEAASRFVDAFEAAVEFARANPRAVVRVRGEVRRWNLRRFPYALIFRSVDDVIEILAVMHARREPEYWKSRLRGPG
jgi:plasmid stabilization system protein ParE